MNPNKRKLNREFNLPIMEKTCIRLGVKIVAFTPYQFRLSKAGFVTIDYYPSSNKVFFHDVEEYGEVTNVRVFLNYQFSLKV